MSEKHDDGDEPHVIRAPFFLTVAELSLLCGVLVHAKRTNFVPAAAEPKPDKLIERLMRQCPPGGSPWAP